MQRWVRITFWLVCAASAMAASQPSNEDFVLIVHPDNPISHVSTELLQKIFLKRIVRWPDQETFIKPVDLAPSATARERFSRAVLGRSVSAVRSYWQQRIFSGQGIPPLELSNEELVVKYILEHPGAVGYVSKRTAVGPARVLVIK